MPQAVVVWHDRSRQFNYWMPDRIDPKFSIRFCKNLTLHHSGVVADGEEFHRVASDLGEEAISNNEITCGDLLPRQLCNWAMRVSGDPRPNSIRFLLRRAGLRRDGQLLGRGYDFATE